MSEELKVEDEIIPTHVVLDDLDWFLQNAIITANSGAFELNITLTVGGSLVTGILIGGREYFTLLAEQYSDAFTEVTNEKRKEIYDSISVMGDRYTDASTDAPFFIHMKGAKYVGHSGNFLPTSHEILWRGRLSQVAGYSLGRLTLNSPAK